MTVAGNLAFQSGAFYLVQVDPSNASRANVTAGGTATLAGTAVAAFAPGSYVTRNYTILSATGGLGGSTFDALATGNLPAGFTARLDYTNSDVILNLTATLATAGLGGNQRNVAGTLNNFFNGGGALPPAFLPVFGLTGGNLGNALSRLSGEAATGAQQGAFQLGGQFLNLMLDPFADGRGGVGGAGGPAIGFATARAALPEEIARAYARAMKAPVTEAPPGFAQRWSAWGGGFGGASRGNGDPAARQPRSFRAHRRFCRRPRLSPDAGHDGRFCARRRRHQLEPRAGAGWRQERRLPGRRLRHHARGSGLSRHRLRLCPALDVDRPHRLRRRPSHRRVQRAEFWRTHRGRLSHRHDAGRVHALCGAAGAKLPHALLRETDVNGGGFALAYDARTATATRSELGARFDHAVALDPTALLTLRARLAWAHDWVSDPTLVAGFQTLPGASFIVSGARPARILRSPRSARSCASPTASRYWASSTANSPPAPPPIPAPPPCDTRGAAICTRVPDAAQYGR